MLFKKFRVAVVVVLFLLSSFHVHRTEARQTAPLVSVFDVQQEKVVKAIPLTSDLRAALTAMLQSSPVMYGGLSPEPVKGMVLHIPFEHAPLRISNVLYPSTIKEMYLFLESAAQPKALLFFTAPHRPIVVLLQTDANQFLQQHINSY